MSMYVSMTDSFMSGWGCAEGRINKFVVACQTREQLLTIVRAAKSRSEMKYIRTCSNKPTYNERTHLTTYSTYDQLGSVWKQA